MDNQALEIIDMLYTMIAEAWGVPLGNDKCIVERDKALGLLDDLKAVLPLELSEARRRSISRPSRRRRRPSASPRRNRARCAAPPEPSWTTRCEKPRTPSPPRWKR